MNKFSEIYSYDTNWHFMNLESGWVLLFINFLLFLGTFFITYKSFFQNLEANPRIILFFPLGLIFMIVFTINSYLDFKNDISIFNTKIESEEIIIYEGYLRGINFKANRVELYCEDTIMQYFQSSFNHKLISSLYEKLPQKDSIKILFTKERDILRIYRKHKL